MLGMRERKKQERRDELIAAAVELFRQTGYEQTTMEDIAARADVSAPTLYRYFPTKSDLLLGLFWETRAAKAGKLDKFHATAEMTDAVTAVTDLICLNNSGIDTLEDRKMWREIMAALLRIHDAANDEFQAYKAVFEAHLRKILLRLKSEGLLSTDLPVEPMVGTLYAVAAEIFYRMIANEHGSTKETRRAVDMQVRVILHGWIEPDRKTEDGQSVGR